MMNLANPAVMNLHQSSLRESKPRRRKRSRLKPSSLRKSKPRKRKRSSLKSRRLLLRRFKDKSIRRPVRRHLLHIPVLILHTEDSGPLIPEFCPEVYCTDAVPPNPPQAVTDAYKKYHEVLTKDGPNARILPRLSVTVCMAITHEREQIWHTRAAKGREWLVKIDFADVAGRIRAMKPQLDELISVEEKKKNYCTWGYLLEELEAVESPLEISMKKPMKKPSGPSRKAFEHSRPG
jgi:hypothetical protein